VEQSRVVDRSLNNQHVVLGLFRGERHSVVGTARRALIGGIVIHLTVRKVDPDQLELLRGWMAQLNGPRREEALATLDDEGCSHEIALLIEGPEGPLVIYAMEVESIEKSRAAAGRSTHRIDQEHRAVMEKTVGERPSLEKLLDLRR
jgi:hypothetical protein